MSRINRKRLLACVVIGAAQLVVVASMALSATAREPSALQHGAPSGPCVHSDRSRSLPVGTTLGAVTTRGLQRVRSVVDVNEIDGPPETRAVSSSISTISSPLLGWLYLDDGGGRWFQAAPKATWTSALSDSVKAYLRLGVAPESARSPVYVRNKPRSAAVLVGFSVIKCWERGRVLARK